MQVRWKEGSGSISLWLPNFPHKLQPRFWSSDHHHHILRDFCRLNLMMVVGLFIIKLFGGFIYQFLVIWQIKHMHIIHAWPDQFVLEGFHWNWNNSFTAKVCLHVSFFWCLNWCRVGAKCNLNPVSMQIVCTQYAIP